LIKISQATPEEVLSQQAYILFYQKQGFIPTSGDLNSEYLEIVSGLKREEKLKEPEGAEIQHKLSEKSIIDHNISSFNLNQLMMRNDW